MTCQQFEELVSARLDGELSGDEEKILQAHLEICPACRQLAADLDAVRGELHKGHAAEMSPGTQRAILKATIAGAWRTVPGYYLIPRRVLWATAAVIILAGVSLVTGVLPIKKKQGVTPPTATPAGQLVVFTEQDIVRSQIIVGGGK
jgi:anti-sigma factor RsiW